MWAVAGSIYGGCKWLSFVDCAASWFAPRWKAAGYLLLWPGMNARAFFVSARPAKAPQLAEWLLCLGKLATGVMLVGGAVWLVDWQPYLAGCIGMAGVVVTLHFGVFHLLSLAWRRSGVNAPAIMNNPVASTSLSEFWGGRWNLAVRDLAHHYVFRPLVGPLGVAGATMCVFVVSGAVHDVVISLPAGAGYGLPTLYFLLQGVALLAERSSWGRRCPLGKGLVGWLYCAVVTIGPLGLLFHRPFIERVVVPMLQAMAKV